MGYAWEGCSSEELMDVRLCDLGLKLEGTWLEEITARVCGELHERGLRLTPHFWLADEWFSPDGVPGVALPFYLAHRRLIRLEREQMFEVEGGTRAECVRIVRHEVGHAVDHAFGVYRRRRYQSLFGKASTTYPDFYRPNPASRRYVQHLDGWYAQSHPSEDFAETFAVWLNPRSKWRRQYRGWPALKKLEYVDELMAELAGQKPRVRDRSRPYSLSKLRHTLRTHYDRKRDHYRAGYSEAYDRDLLKIFSDDEIDRHRPTAASFLRRRRSDIRELVAKWTGEYEFTLDQVLKQMLGRCRELKLRTREHNEDPIVDFAIMLAVHTVHSLHRGTEWHPL
ncbi:MAG: putative zinc-binding metallopeptidase [Myxococcota bacterium]